MSRRRKSFLRPQNYPEGFTVVSAFVQGVEVEDDTAHAPSEVRYNVLCNGCGASLSAWKSHMSNIACSHGSDLGKHNTVTLVNKLTFATLVGAAENFKAVSNQEWWLWVPDALGRGAPAMCTWEFSRNKVWYTPFTRDAQGLIQPLTPEKYMTPTQESELSRAKRLLSQSRAKDLGLDVSGRTPQPPTTTHTMAGKPLQPPQGHAPTHTSSAIPVAPQGLAVPPDNGEDAPPVPLSLQPDLGMFPG